MSTQDRIKRATTALVKHKGYDFAAGFLATQLELASLKMSKAKQIEFLANLESAVGMAVTVKVKNCLTGEEVEIPWNNLGTVLDPSTEHFHSY